MEGEASREDCTALIPGVNGNPEGTLLRTHSTNPDRKTLSREEVLKELLLEEGGIALRAGELHGLPYQSTGHGIIESELQSWRCSRTPAWSFMALPPKTDPVATPLLSNCGKGGTAPLCHFGRLEP